MEETSLFQCSMDLENSQKPRLSSFTSTTSDFSDLFSDDPVEQRINKWLDDQGVRMFTPEEK